MLICKLMFSNNVIIIKCLWFYSRLLLKALLDALRGTGCVCKIDVKWEKLWDQTTRVNDDIAIDFMVFVGRLL